MKAVKNPKDLSPKPASITYPVAFVDEAAMYARQLGDDIYDLMDRATTAGDDMQRKDLLRAVLSMEKAYKGLIWNLQFRPTDKPTKKSCPHPF